MIINKTFFSPLCGGRYESVIATLCENLDSLDEPEARAAMIWIVGEYAERIDNADELLESFLEGFHDESTQVGGSRETFTPQRGRDHNVCQIKLPIVPVSRLLF